MEEGDFQFQPGISVMFTASPESPDIDWDGLDQIPILGDISSPEVAMDASSSHRLPSFFASPSIFASDATTTTAATNTFLSQPNTCSSQPGAGVAHDMASEGAVVDLDSDLLEQLLPGDNPWPELATNDSISSGSFASRSTVPLDATTNWGTPASTNTCLIQPSIPVPRTTSSEDAAVDADHLLEQPRSLSGATTHGLNWRPKLQALSSYSLLAPPSPHMPKPPSTPSSANTCIQWSGACSSVRKQVTQALAYIRETQSYNTVLALLWGPSFAIDQRSDNLIPFWSISRIFEFFMGVGSLFMGSQDLDAQSFTTKYQLPMPMPTVNLVKDLDVRGALRVPVFEKGNHSCFGIIDLISTTDKLNFTSELDTICSALQAVNLTITPFSSISRTKFNTTSYEEAIPEILHVLRAACIIHKLPLAQTWVTCGQQGKWCRRHSDENYRYCICTIDAACYVNDPRMQFFHEACSKHHLLPGQGVAGKAFATNQPCFQTDVGSSSEQEYPLSHHAKIFRLKGVMAIRLRSTRTGMADFVLEFFLPTDCEVEKEQKTVLDSLSVTMQSLSKTLCVVTDKEMEDDAMCGMNEIYSVDLHKKKAMKRKRMARRSTVWNSFTEVMVGDIVKAKCNHCGHELCCDSKTHGTSSLKSHLERCKLNPNNRITDPL